MESSGFLEMCPPGAFPLVAVAPVDEPPLQDHAARIARLHASQSISEGAFWRMWSVVDAFLAGFLLLLATSSRGADVEDGAEASRELREAVSVSRSEVLSAEAFDHGLDIIIEGIRNVEALD